MNPQLQEHFSFDSCQQDFFPLDSSFYEIQYDNYEETIFRDESQADLESFFVEGTESKTEIFWKSSQSSEKIQIPLVKALTQNFFKKSTCNESSEASQSAIYHYRNLRRKKDQRGRLQKVYRIGCKFAALPSDSENDGNQEKLTSKLTKNLLAFGKKPHLKVIRQTLGLKYFKSNKYLTALQKKDGINMEDYDRMYRCPELRKALEKFFNKKTIDRELMISRTTAENKIFYRYYLEVFERNFRKGSFKSISETMMEIQKQKKYL